MSEPNSRDPFSGSYLDPSAHKAMLQDVVRTTAYDEALRRVIQPGEHVIDFGSGSGVLAIFAARHGAGRVDAIERTGFIEVARRIARASGQPDIVFHHTDHESFATDGQADVLVSEWMGHFLFFEAMLEPLLSVRNRWLSPEGRMVPARVSTHATLVTDETYYEDLAFLLHQPYGIDFGSIATAPLEQCHLVALEPEQVLGTVFELGTLDMKTLQRTPECVSAQASVTETATVYGILAWFSMELAEDFVIGTGPHDPETHWQQVFFPFVEPIEVSPERPITLTIWPPTESEDEEPSWRWAFDDGVTRLETDSSRHRQALRAEAAALAP